MLIPALFKGSSNPALPKALINSPDGGAAAGGGSVADGGVAAGGFASWVCWLAGGAAGAFSSACSDVLVNVAASAQQATATTNLSIFMNYTSSSPCLQAMQSPPK